MSPPRPAGQEAGENAGGEGADLEQLHVEHGSATRLDDAEGDEEAGAEPEGGETAGFVQPIVSPP